MAEDFLQLADRAVFVDELLLDRGQKHVPRRDVEVFAVRADHGLQKLPAVGTVGEDVVNGVLQVIGADAQTEAGVGLRVQVDEERPLAQKSERSGQIGSGF